MVGLPLDGAELGWRLFLRATGHEREEKEWEEVFHLVMR